MVQREPDGTGVARAVPELAATERPRLAYSALERRATLTTVGILVALAGVAWWSTVRTASGMGSMAAGLAQVGTAMPFHMSVPVFMAMWTTMMVAMMFPTVAPIVLLHRLVLKRRGKGPQLTAVFASGYLAIWAVIGLVPLVALVAFREVSPEASWVGPAAGVVLVIAGAYQFTRWKDACLRACRTPLTFLATHDFGTGARGVLRAGASHGLYCFGCCWALMAVLFVVGLMNLAWMAAIAVVFLAEKNWKRGPVLSKVVGSAVVLLGLVILVEPAVLHAMVGTGSTPGSGMP